MAGLTMERFYKLLALLNEFDEHTINRLSYAVEEEHLYYNKQDKIYRIVEYCLSKRNKKGRELKKFLLNLLEKYTKIFDDFNSKKEKLISGSYSELENYIQAYWKPF